MADADVLFQQHRRSVFRYLSRIVGGAEAAHDLTQEVFLRVVRSRVPDAEPSACKAWVFRIARNLALNHLRDGRRRPQAAELIDRAGPASQELSAAIKQAIAALPELERDVFLLRETAGLSYAEIAAACELSVDAVRARLHRARQQLRETLADPIRVRRRHGVSLAGYMGPAPELDTDAVPRSEREGRERARASEPPERSGATESPRPTARGAPGDAVPRREIDDD